MFHNGFLTNFVVNQIQKLHKIKKKIAILGSTGSIGVNSLEVLKNNSDKFVVNYLTTNKNVELLAKQTKIFKPKAVVILDENIAKSSKHLFSDSIKVYSGLKSLHEIVKQNDIDIVLNALVGFSGVIPTYNSILSGKNILLANKETLVAAGEIIMPLAKKNNVSIIPIDSEHSAILQCLIGEENNQVDKIYLTASGGAFLNHSINELKAVTIKQALKHPNWSMGSKITIDSATMMNKGLEVIEAHWLFNLSPKKIKILIHPQSIIHSMVEFSDGSIKAQLGVPDMKIPIQYALSFPKRFNSNFKRIDFSKLKTLNFSEPDFKKYPSLNFAYDALNLGGTIPAILNASNEIAVEKFLKNKISFLEIFNLIEKTVSKIKNIKRPTINDIVESDLLAREIAKTL